MTIRNSTRSALRSAPLALAAFSLTSLLGCIVADGSPDDRDDLDGLVDPAVDQAGDENAPEVADDADDAAELADNAAEVADDAVVLPEDSAADLSSETTADGTTPRGAIEFRSPTRTARIIGTTLQVRDDNKGYITLNTAAAQVALASARVVMRQTNGAVWAKTGALTSAWVQLAPAGSAVQIDAAVEAIAIRTPTGAIRIKRGPLTAPWVTYVASGAKQVALAGCAVGLYETAPMANCMNDMRVGYIDAANSFRLRRLNAPWRVVANNVAEIAMDGWMDGFRRMGSGAFYVRDNKDVEPPWRVLATGATRIAVGFHTVGYTAANGSLYAKPITATRFTLITTGNPAFSLLSGRIAIRRATSALLTRKFTEEEGIGPWVSQGTGTSIATSRFVEIRSSAFGFIAQAE